MRKRTPQTDGYRAIHRRPAMVRSGAADAAQERLIQELCTTCNTVMDDDFNAPKLVANLHEMATQINIYYNNGKKVNNISKAAFDTFISTCTPIYLMYSACRTKLKAATATRWTR